MIGLSDMISKSSELIMHIKYLVRDMYSVLFLSLFCVHPARPENVKESARPQACGSEGSVVPFLTVKSSWNQQASGTPASCGNALATSVQQGSWPGSSLTGQVLPPMAPAVTRGKL